MVERAEELVSVMCFPPRALGCHKASSFQFELFFFLFICSVTLHIAAPSLPPLPRYPTPNPRAGFLYLQVFTIFSSVLWFSCQCSSILFPAPPPHHPHPLPPTHLSPPSSLHIASHAHDHLPPHPITSRATPAGACHWSDLPLVRPPLTLILTLTLIGGRSNGQFLHLHGPSPSPLNARSSHLTSSARRQEKKYIYICHRNKIQRVPPKPPKPPSPDLPPHLTSHHHEL